MVKCTSNDVKSPFNTRSLTSTPGFKNKIKKIRSTQTHGLMTLVKFMLNWTAESYIDCEEGDLDIYIGFVSLHLSD